MHFKRLDEYFKQASVDQPTKIAMQMPTQQKYRITGFYKETQFQETHIGKIPKEWMVDRFNNLFSYVKGKKPKSLFENPCEGCLPYLTTDYLRSGNLSQFAKVEKGTIAVKENDVLLLWDGSNAGEFFQGKIGILASTMVKIEPKVENLLNVFAYYYMKYKFEPILKSSTKGTGIPHVDSTVLDSLIFPIPPLEEQWGIAEVLSSVDQAIEATERLVKKLEEIKRGLMRELLTKGIGHKEYQNTEIGKIPKEWQVVKLGTLFSFKNGERPRVVKENGPIPIYGAGFIQGYTDDYMIDKNNVIIVARVGKGSAGKVYIASGKMWISDNAIYAVPKTNSAYPIFYYYLLQFLRLDKVAVRSAAGGYSLITQSSLSNLHVPFPPYEEQKEIGDILLSIDNWINVEEKRKSALESLKRGLMELLLTGRVRVRVEKVPSG